MRKAIKLISVLITTLTIASIVLPTLTVYAAGSTNLSSDNVSVSRVIDDSSRRSDS